MSHLFCCSTILPVDGMYREVGDPPLSYPIDQCYHVISLSVSERKRGMRKREMLIQSLPVATFKVGVHHFSIARLAIVEVSLFKKNGKETEILFYLHLYVFT